MNITNKLEDNIIKEKLPESIVSEVYHYINNISCNNINFSLHVKKMDILANHIKIINNTIEQELELHIMNRSINSKNTENQIIDNTYKYSLFNTLANFQNSLTSIKKIIVCLTIIIILFTVVVFLLIKNKNIESTRVETINHPNLIKTIEPKNHEVFVSELLTPEENLIVNIQDKIDNLMAGYYETLINKVEIDYSKNSLILFVNTKWYDLPVKEQDSWAGEVFVHVQKLNFSKLIIKNLDNIVIARSPVVGKQVVIFERHL
ncbi:MAG: hypothetical protein ucyna2_00518 [Candidatus Atelocyanobacterium thalassa isolate SIO64986]|uniref:Uncharacterized protein n=1 Tax=Candidatus Atelocyanobacterium thalassa isolate SIO64986 TaxID=1527444 RepID=A0A086CHH8_9CHRO|nr:MAG: hypothetical protein ucyna2_00518 [Candidatus Atelocyanobacterium thalassa isolate SIO64986]